MRLFVAQPLRRLNIAVLAALLVGSTAAVASAQDPAQQQPQQAAAPAQPDPLRLTAGPAMLYNQIKGDQAAAFEAAWAEIRAGLAASAKPELQQQAAAMKIYKINAPAAAGQPTVYLFFMETLPAGGATFDPIKLLYESGAFERAKADEIYAKIKDAYMQIAPWPLVAIGG